MFSAILNIIHPHQLGDRLFRRKCLPARKRTILGVCDTVSRERFCASPRRVILANRISVEEAQKGRENMYMKIK